LNPTTVMPVMPVVSALFENADRLPNRLALIADNEAVTYGELRQRILSAHAILKDMGVEPGDRVVLAASTEPEFVYGYFAVHLLGAICVPIDPKTSAERLSYIKERTDAKWLFGIGDPAHKDSTRSLDTLGAVVKASEDVRDPEPDAIADLMFTSGTTGEPKGVTLLHRNIASAARQINEFIGNAAEDVEVMPLPLSHSFGLGRLRCNFVAGSTVVLVNGFTVPSRIFEALSRFSATGLVFVPAAFGLLQKASPNTIGKFARQLKYIEIGSSPMPLEHKEALCTLLPNTRICMHYGLTEASRSAFIEFHRDGHKLNSIGKPTPGVQIMVADGRARPVADEQEGNLWVRGKHRFFGYWRDEGRTEEVLNDEWFNTEDLGHRDKNGYFYLHARESDMINVGGRKVSPVEIERLLEEHPGVEQCACVGVSDPRGIADVVIVAYLVSSDVGSGRPTPVQLAKLLRGRVEPYKMPASYRWIDRLPRTESGKLKRSALKDA
jgi:long-chain acyl-CoA synthetase